MLLLDWPLTWKLPGLVAPTRGITPASIVFRVTEAHKPPHHDKVATTGEVFFLLVFFIFYFFKFFLKFFLKLKKKSSLDPPPLLYGSWFWNPLYQFLVCSLLSSSPLGHIHLINQATVSLCSLYHDILRKWKCKGVHVFCMCIYLCCSLSCNYSGLHLVVLMVPQADRSLLALISHPKHATPSLLGPYVHFPLSTPSVGRRPENYGTLQLLTLGGEFEVPLEMSSELL